MPIFMTSTAAIILIAINLLSLPVFCNETVEVFGKERVIGNTYIPVFAFYEDVLPGSESLRA